MRRTDRPLLLAFLALLLPLCAAPARAEMPSLMQPSSGLSLPGKLIFAQLATPDLAASERFYGALLGWTFRDVAGLPVPYAEALDGNGDHVAGLFELPPDEAHSGSWLPFFSTPDTDRAVAVAEHYGANASVRPRDVGALGREAVIVDAAGARVGLLASASGDPPDDLAGEGSWIWCALFTPDPRTATDFYAAVLGEAAAPAANAPSGDHLILSNGGYARGSVNPLLGHRPGSRPRWLPFVRVGDVDAAAARAAQLGGRVLVAAHLDRDGLPVAIIADPGGSAIGLMQWTGNAS